MISSLHNIPSSVAFKNCAPFTKCITKIDGTTIDDAEDLDLVMSVYILLEYNSNYSETTGSLWFYSKSEATNFNADITNNIKLKSFEFKANLLGETEADGNNGILKNSTIAVPLKYLSNFWRSFEMPLINCKIELILNGQSTVFCLQLVLIMIMLTAAIFFSLSKAKNCMSLL